MYNMKKKPRAADIPAAAAAAAAAAPMQMPHQKEAGLPSSTAKRRWTNRPAKVQFGGRRLP